MQKSLEMVDNKRKEDEPKIMIFSLYAIQSFYFGFYSSLPLTYSNIPDYQTLSIFALAGIPYSCKFLMAPFQELYYFRSYGKRKTWIVGSLIILILTTIMMGVMVGRQKHQIVVALLLMISILASAIKDVSTDALAVETISNLSTISTIQFTAQQIGQITTLSIFLALVSKGYWASFGIKYSIISASTFIYGIAIFIIFVTLWIHFKFVEKSGQHSHESEQSKLDFGQIIRYFRNFMQPTFKICRISIFFLLSNHGLLYYSSTFEIEMIRRQYIQRQSIMFMRDFSIVLSLVSCYFLGKYLQNKCLLNYSWYFSITLFVICFSAFMIESEDKWVILFLQVVIKVSRSCIYYVQLCLIKEYSKGPLLGINITTLLSIRNLGSNTSIQNELIYIFQYNNAMKIGFFIALITILGTPFFNKWIDQGKMIEIKPKKHHHHND